MIILENTKGNSFYKVYIYDYISKKRKKWGKGREWKRNLDLNDIGINQDKFYWLSEVTPGVH